MEANGNLYGLIIYDLKEIKMNELDKEINQAKAYLRAMKKTMLNDKGDCDNVIMHLTNIETLVNNLPIQNVVFSEERAEVCRCKNDNCMHHKGGICFAKAWECASRQT